MNHDATHCADFCSDCPMKCYRAELEVDLRSKWKEFVGVPLSYAHLYGTVGCQRDSCHKGETLQDRPKGEWVECFDGNEWTWYCTNCETKYYQEDLFMGGSEFPNFCPNCGADMRGDKE